MKKKKSEFWNETLNVCREPSSVWEKKKEMLDHIVRAEGQKGKTSFIEKENHLHSESESSL